MRWIVVWSVWIGVRGMYIRGRAAATIPFFRGGDGEVEEAKEI